MLDRGIEYPFIKGNWNKVQDSTSSRSLKGDVLVPMSCQREWWCSQGADCAPLFSRQVSYS